MALRLGQLLGLSLIGCAACVGTARASTNCAHLQAQVSFPNTTIVATRLMLAAGDLPEYCSVDGKIDGTINFSLRLPTNWNGKFLFQTFGGLDGVLGMPEDLPKLQHPVSIGLRRGYAEIATDTGHVSADGTVYDGSWAAHNPQAQINWAYRSTHVVAAAGKAITAQYYSRAPVHSYLLGCSGGGRHAAMSATRYPADFDGIVAGAPFLDPAKEVLAWLWEEQALSEHPIAPAKLPLLNQAVLAACANVPGHAADGFVADPRDCNFEPSTLACKAGGPETDCLTEAEGVTLRKIYAGPRTSKGKSLFFGQEAGTESTLWPKAIVNSVNGGPGELLIRIPNQYLEYFVPAGKKLAPLTFNFDHDTRDLYASGTPFEVTPHLENFVRAGGKLIMYHGWADPRIPPRATLAFYEAAQHNAAAAGVQLDTAYRLYMMPGMGHCFGGPGPDKVDWLQYLEQWVEHGVAPAAVDASRSANVLPALDAPVCPYPTRSASPPGTPAAAVKCTTG